MRSFNTDVHSLTCDSRCSSQATSTRFLCGFKRFLEVSVYYSSIKFYFAKNHD